MKYELLTKYHFYRLTYDNGLSENILVDSHDVEKNTGKLEEFLKEEAKKARENELVAIEVKE